MNTIDKNIDFELRRLMGKYDSYESLRDRAVSSKCEDPDRQDDFIIWKYLKSAGHELSDEKGKKNKKRDINSGKDQVDAKNPNEQAAETLEPDSLGHDVEEVRIAIFSEYLSFETFDIYQSITPKRMEILDYININEPGSVKDLATGLGRDYKNVYDDVLALSNFCLVNLVKTGRNKIPVTRVDYVQVIPRKY